MDRSVQNEEFCPYRSHGQQKVPAFWKQNENESVSHSAMSDSVITWTVACQAPLAMGFSRQEYWSGLPCPPPGDLPDPGIEPRSVALQADSLPSEPPGKPWKQRLGAKFPICPQVSPLNPRAGGFPAGAAVTPRLCCDSPGLVHPPPKSYKFLETSDTSSLLNHPCLCNPSPFKRASSLLR